MRPASTSAWLAQRPRFPVHDTPTYPCLLAQPGGALAWDHHAANHPARLLQHLAAGFYEAVEAIYPGPKGFCWQEIEQFVAAYNKTKAPFNWTAARADSILEKLQRFSAQISGPAQEKIVAQHRKALLVDGGRSRWAFEHRQGLEEDQESRSCWPILWR